jgi:hypothetical protein
VLQLIGHASEHEAIALAPLIFVHAKFDLGFHHIINKLIFQQLDTIEDE